MAATQFITTDYSYVSLAGATGAALNALANDGDVLSDAIDNSTLKHNMIKISVNLSAVNLSAQASPHVRLRFIDALDDTPTLFSNNSPQSFGITVPLEIGTGSQAHLEVGEMFASHHFKIAVVNKTGVAFAPDDNNILTYTLYTEVTNI